MSVFSVWIVYSLFWFAGVCAFAFYNGVPPETAWSGPFFIWLAGIMTLMVARPEIRLALLLAGIVGFLAELLGVHTDIVFSGYTYTAAFGSKFMEVPWVMVSAWIIVIGYATALFRARIANPWLFALVGACWLVAIDLVIDPVAVYPMKIWIWEDPGHYYGIPFENFLGWFMVGFVCLYLVHRATPKYVPNPGLGAIGVSIVLFDATIALSRGMFLPAMLGFGLALAHVHLRRSEVAGPSAMTGPLRTARQSAGTD